MSKKRKKSAREDELRKKIKNLEWQDRVLHRMRLHNLEELQTTHRKLRRLEAKPKRKRKRPSKCRSSGERVQAAFRLPDGIVPAVPLSIH